MMKQIKPFLINARKRIKNRLGRYCTSSNRASLNNVSLPECVVIETTNACNLRCKMCPMWGENAANDRQVGFIDVNFYKKIVNEISQYGHIKISPCGAGEPLLHPQFFEMIRYANKCDALTYIITNGVFLNLDNAERILESGLDEIAISIDGVNKETYEGIRIGSNFDNLISNVNQFLTLKKQRRLNKPWVKLFMVRLPENENEVDAFIDKWLPSVDEVLIQEYRFEHMRARKMFQFNCHLQRVPCQRLWSTAAISWDGKVGLCCEDVALEVVMGDLRENTLKDIWFGSAFQKMRQIHLQGEYNKAAICVDCDAWVETYTDVKFKGDLKIEKNPRIQRYIHLPSGVSDWRHNSRLYLRNVYRRWF